MATVRPVPDTQPSFKGVSAAAGDEKACLYRLRLSSNSAEYF